MALCLALIAGMIHLPFWMRMRTKRPRGRIRMAALLAIVIPVSGLGFMLLNGWTLVNLAQRLHADDCVRQIAAIDLNALEADAEQV